MRRYTWDEYYEKYYDWAESTKVRNLSYLTSLGSADEVGEIIIDLQANISASNRLLHKAVEAGLAFSCYDLLEFVYANDKGLAEAAARNSAGRLSAEDMEDLYGEIDDGVIIDICRQGGIMLPEELREEENAAEEDDYIDDYAPEPPAPRRGFFATLAAMLAGAGAGVSAEKRRSHGGRCDGDCANCPPHYGYRYGRWYYGHDHAYGCEFGGNRGGGSMD